MKSEFGWKELFFSKSSFLIPCDFELGMNFFDKKFMEDEVILVIHKHWGLSIDIYGIIKFFA